MKRQFAICGALCAALTVFAGLGTAKADHTTGHDEVARGGLLALEERVFDLESRLSPMELSVDCDNGESISDALETGFPSVPIVITVSGTCKESVAIARDDVTIQGVDPSDPTKAIVDAVHLGSNVIVIDGGARITLNGLTLRNGGRSGVVAANGAAITVRNAAVVNNAGNGVFVGLNATAVVNDNTIENNGGDGVAVRFSSFARITDNTIQGNGANGVRVSDTASVWVGFDFDGAAHANTITQNGRNGILIHNGASAVLRANTISGNGGLGGVVVARSTAALIGENDVNSNGYGIFVEEGTLELPHEDPDRAEDKIRQNANDGIIAINNSSLEVRQGLIEGNGTAQGGDNDGISVNDNSYLRIRRATVQNNDGSGIVLRRGGGVLFRAPNATVTGHGGEFDLACRPADNETHYGALNNDDLDGIGTIDGNCPQVFP